MIWFLIFSPIIATVICILLFRLEKYTPKKVSSFLGYLIMGVVLGILLGVGITVASTIYFDNPQGPFAIIIYGPLGIAVGELLATFFWRQHLRKGRLVTE